MPPIFEYLIKQAISLAIIYLFYWAVLRRLTFYNRNRWYLLGYSVLSFLIPFINISPFLQKNEWTDNKLLNIIPVFENTPANTGIETIAVSGGWTAWDGMLCLLIAGVCLMLARLLIQLLSLQKMKKTSRLVSEDKVRVYQVNKSIIPFSFGNSIFINQEMHNEEELKKVISHEFVHVRQKHSMDILWAELLCILNWFNPFSWFIRSAIRQNLEFIADSKVIDEGIDKQQYQYLLLKVIGNNHFSIANQFNFSSLKKRIAMMNKMRTARVQLVKFLFVLPVIAVLLLAFRDRFANKTRDPFASKTINGSANQLNKAAGQLDQATNVFGQMAVAVNKSSLVFDTVPEKFRMVEERMREYVRPYSLYKSDEMTSEQRAFFERNPKVNLLHWKKLSIEVYLSNGAVEEYDLGTDREKLEKKYGKLPPKGGSAPYISTVDGVTTTVSAVSVEEPITVTGFKIPDASAVSSTEPITVMGLKSPNALVPSISTTQVDNARAISVDGSLAIASTVPGIPIEAIETGEKIMEFKIYKRTKKAELDKLVEQAKAKGVALEFDDPEYNDKGELVSLSGTMKKDNAKSNFTVTDFEIVRLILYKSGDRYSIAITTNKKELI